MKRNELRPRQFLIDPAEMRRPALLQTPAVPLNQYLADPAAELARYGQETLVRIDRDMVVIREFETMLDRIKKEGSYQGIEYQHKGPAHLPMGRRPLRWGRRSIWGQKILFLGRTVRTVRFWPRACRPSPNWTTVR
jgi:2-oxoisovalerate dehydrogenase E1 component